MAAMAQVELSFVPDMSDLPDLSVFEAPDAAGDTVKAAVSDPALVLPPTKLQPKVLAKDGFKKPGLDTTAGQRSLLASPTVNTREVRQTGRR